MSNCWKWDRWWKHRELCVWCLETRTVRTVWILGGGGKHKGNFLPWGERWEQRELFRTDNLFTLRWQMNTENCLSWGGKWEQRELFTMRWEEQVGLFTFSIGGENTENSLPWAWEVRTEGTVYLVVGGENRGVYLEVEDENIQKSLPWNGRWQRIKLYLEIRDENTQLFPLR